MSDLSRETHERLPNTLVPKTDPDEVKRHFEENPESRLMVGSVSYTNTFYKPEDGVLKPEDKERYDFCVEHSHKVELIELSHAHYDAREAGLAAAEHSAKMLMLMSRLGVLQKSDIEMYSMYGVRADGRRSQFFTRTYSDLFAKIGMQARYYDVVFEEETLAKCEPGLNTQDSRAV